jgi:hypothetical protein
MNDPPPRHHRPAPSPAGPTPTTAFCTGCHDNLQKALALPNALTLTQFADDDTDLHRQHAEDASDEGERLCLACHAPHQSGNRALVRLKPVDDGEPGTFTGLPGGGRCSGSCHEDDEVAYCRKGGVCPPAAVSATDEED